MLLRPRMMASLLAALLTACGGGGGGSGEETGGTAGLSLLPSSALVTANTSNLPPQSTIDIRFGGSAGRAVQAFATNTFHGISRVEAVMDSASRGRVRIFFRHPADVGPGSHTDQVTLQLCYDAYCRDPVPDGTRVIQARYTVSLPTAPEPALTASAAPGNGGTLVAQTLAMGDHNVVDAAYSPLLQAIVMISTSPVNALYVYDIASNTEARLDLGSAPIALGLGTDGRTVAVAQQVYRLLYATLPDTGVPDRLEELPVNILTSDLLLTRASKLHVLPGRLGGVYADAVATFQLPSAFPDLSAFGVPLDMMGTLHPAEHAIYAIPPLSAPAPRNIIRYDVRGAKAIKLRESADEGTHPGCGRLWISVAGNRLFTGCGAVFRASEVAEHDLTYMGGFRFFGPTGGIQSLSESVPAGEIAIAETNNESCYRAPFAECSSRLNFYDRNTLAAAESYALPGNLLAGFVFHDAAGERVYVIGRWYRDPTLPALAPSNTMLRLAR